MSNISNIGSSEEGKNRMKDPYIGFGNDQLESAPLIGKTAKCKVCGADVLIEESCPPGLQFISHCGKSWLVGINGKDIQNTKPACSGKV
jgi:hypothetical protein